MNPTVVCHSEYTYAQRPASFSYGGEQIQIVSVLGEWYTPEGKGFKAQVEDGCIYTLFYNQLEDSWEIRGLIFPYQSLGYLPGAIDS